jgi:hypothetical protein
LLEFLGLLNVVKIEVGYYPAYCLRKVNQQLCVQINDDARAVIIHFKTIRKDGVTECGNIDKKWSAASFQYSSVSIIQFFPSLFLFVKCILQQ